MQQALKAAAPAVVTPLLARFDDALAQGWLSGQAFSAVDVYSLVLRRWAERLGVDVTTFASWAAHHRRVLQWPAVQRALQHEQTPDTAGLTAAVGRA